MKKNRIIIFILSGTLIAIFIIIGINVLTFNKKLQDYEADNNYTSNNDISNDVKKKSKIDEVSKDVNDITEPNKDIELNDINDETDENTDIEESNDSKSFTQEEVKGDIKDSSQIVSSQNDEDDSSQNNNENNSNTNIENIPEKLDQEYTNHEWVDEKINENREDIADNDLEAGLSLGDKIDDDILLGYLEDGLTKEEKVDLQEYLEVVLTPEECKELNVLFEKYNYIFDK
ncbi:hypothetical protein AN1V17_13610 [Vallitalea sediminicola]